MREQLEHWMRQALIEAERALHEGEVPVGAVVVRQDRCLGRGRNRREALRDPSAHAEVQAVQAACRELGDWRLDGATLFVTLEPCPMCAGAALQARIGQVVYGADSPDQGAAGSVLNLLDFPGMPHHLKVTGGVLRGEAERLLRRFFEQRRGEVAEPG